MVRLKNEILLIHFYIFSWNLALRLIDSEIDRNMILFSY